MNYIITYSLTATQHTTADSIEEAQSKLEDYLRDNGVALKQAKLEVLTIEEDPIND